MMKNNEYAWRFKNAGRVMHSALHRFENRVLQLMDEMGFSQTRPTHINLTRHLDLEGTRISLLAERAAMTTAAMSELIDQCEKLGLVKRHPDPTDKRARIVRFTPYGFDWLDAFGNSLKKAEMEMADEVGQDAFNLMVDALYTYGATEQLIEDSQMDESA